MRKLLIVVAILLFPVAAIGFGLGVSNFSLGGALGYPDHTCYPPSKPVVYDDLSISYFKSDMETYRNCVQRYVEGAKNDVSTIQEKADKAVADYNRFVNSL
ncbi:hypothetical protein DA2_3809 [Desulfovibrio sp. A2]|nr:hypothetical protein DA2_3809 [Desulfovibrio sp. A2]